MSEKIKQRQRKDSETNQSTSVNSTKQLRKVNDHRNSTLQLKDLQQGMSSSQELSTEPVQQLKSESPNNTGLPSQLKTGMENLSGMSLDHVKVHYNSPKPAAVQAHAYAQGSDIHVASGQEKHLPHELGHVVQQAQGRVKPTTSVGGMAVNDNPGLENEATVMGNKAMQGG